MGELENAANMMNKLKIQLVNALDEAKHVSLLGSLVQLPVDILLGCGFLAEVFLGSIDLMLQVLVLAKKSVPLLALLIGNVLSLIQGIDKLNLQLVHHVGSILQLLNLPEQVSVFGSNLPLVSLKVSQSKVSFLNLLVDLVQAGNQVLVGLLNRGLGPHNLVSGSANISSLMVDGILVLVNLGLHLRQLVNLLRHLSNSILVLPLQVHEGSLLLDVGLLKILPQLIDFSLSLLAELNLSGGGTTSLSQTLTKLLKLPGKIRPLPLSLSPGLALSLKLLLQLLNAALDLLDGLLGLSNKGLFIIKLGRESRQVLLLPGNGVLSLLLDTL